MTAKAKKPKAAGKIAKEQLSIEAEPGKSDERRRADVALNPAAHGMAATRMFSSGNFGNLDITALFEAHRDKVDEAASGDLSHQKRMLAAQADALNSMFTELTPPAAANTGEYLGGTGT